MQYIPKPLFHAVETEQELMQMTLNQVLESSPIGNLKPAELTTDFKLACQFLYSYRGSKETFKSYRREVERLLQWSWFVQNKRFLDLDRTEIEQYIEFCQKPPLTWIGIKQVNRFKLVNGLLSPNPDWRPFVATVSKKAHRDGQVPKTKTYTLSQTALQSIFAILSSFYNYLLQDDHVHSNPVSQIRQKSKFIRKFQGKKSIRRLSELQWMYVIETAQIMAAENPQQHERTLFMMNALYGMYLRISELAASDRWIPQMKHFHQDIDGNWWFKTVGKGNKERDISVSDAMLNALKRYRLYLGLTSLPSPADNTPLIPKSNQAGPITEIRHIRKIIQTCFDEAMQRMINDGLKEESEALSAATVHWLRHTGISDDVKQRPREHVRDDAGHSSSAITDKYIDIELRERHASGKKKLIIKDSIYEK